MIELKLKEYFLSAVFENITDYFFYFHDTKGKYIYISPSVKQILGYSNKEFTKKYVEYLTDNPLNEKCKNYTDEALKGKKMPAYLIEVFHKDKSKKILHLSETPVFKDNKVVGIAGIVKDMTEKIKLEEKLKKTEGEFKTVFENTNDAIFWADAETGIIVNCNRKAELLSERSRDELIGMHQTKLHPPDTAEFSEEEFKKRAVERNPLQITPMEFELFSKSGKRIPVIISTSLIELKKQIIMQGIFYDITNIKNFEKKILKLNNELEIKVQERTEELAVTIEELRATTEELTNTNELLTKANKQLSLKKEELKELNIQLENKVVERTNKLLEANEKLYAANQQLTGMSEELQRSNEELISTNNELHKAYQRYDAIFENAFDGILMTDIQTKKHIMVNKKFCQMTGYTENEIYNMSLLDLHPEEEHNYIKTNFEKFTIHNIKLDEKLELKVLRKDGSIFEAEINPFKIEMNNKIYMTAVFKDVTKEKKLTEQLFNSERLAAVGQLTAGIAHEFNNILAIIRGYAQIAKLELSKDIYKNFPDSLKVIEEQTQRGASIVSNMLDFSRPRKPQFEPTNIADIILKVIKLQSQQLTFDNIKIEMKFNHTSLLNIDRTQIQQMFLNLLINARHAIIPKKHGSIFIETFEVKDTIQINFSDTGIGMDKKTLNKIFLPFFTTKSGLASDNLKIQGTGLGLAVVYSIIKNHKGFISAQSELNKGASFFIELPIYNNDIQSFSKNESAIKSNKIVKNPNINILIIDDEIDITDSISEYLHLEGYKNITLINSPASAISVIQNNKVDIVFLDLLMPEMNGEILLKKIKKIKPELPVYIISGQIDSKLENKLNSKADGFLRKPFDFVYLLEILNKK